MQKVDISIHDEGDHGEYRAKVEDSEKIGRLTWVERGGVRVAEHTLVPPQIGGRGIAGELVEAMVFDARENGFKIKPVCSYVVAKFNEHPDWADVRA